MSLPITLVFQCPGDEYIRAVAMKYGTKLHAIAFRCTTGGWTAWSGNPGTGSYGHVYASAYGFCGLSGASNPNEGITRLCLDDATDSIPSACVGSGSFDFTDRQCTDSPGNSRARLKGFYFSDGIFGNTISRIMPIWKETESCDNFVGVSDNPWDKANGVYEFDGWLNGHQKYKKNVPGMDWRTYASGLTTLTSDIDVCLYYENKRWKFNFCSDVGDNRSVVFLGSWNKYEQCPYDLSENDHWKWHNAASGWQNVYPQMGLLGLDQMPFGWKNTVFEWNEINIADQGYGTKIQVTIQRQMQTMNGREFTAEEQEGYEKIVENVVEHGGAVTVSAGFKDLIGAEAQYNYAESISNTEAHSVVVSSSAAVQSSTSIMQGMQAQCEITAPTEQQFKAYVYTVYRQSTEFGNGMRQQTCAIRFQTGACRNVPPNCPIGQCMDMQCLFCYPGVKPIVAYDVYATMHPHCFEETAGGQRCPYYRRDFACCTPSQPCGEGEGDCDSDSDCAGSLVCLKDEPGYENGFDVCGVPSGRRLLDLETPTTSASPDSDDHTDLVEFEDEPVEEEEMEHEPVHGCDQFDDEGFCEHGPLEEFCQWNSGKCEIKENVNEDEIPDDDFTWVYNN